MVSGSHSFRSMGSPRPWRTARAWAWLRCEATHPASTEQAEAISSIQTAPSSRTCAPCGTNRAVMTAGNAVTAKAPASAFHFADHI
ncbi:hypothetical protein SMICM304S_01571 [Streptomyces microflavus]